MFHINLEVGESFVGCMVEKLISHIAILALSNHSLYKYTHTHSTILCIVIFNQICALRALAQYSLVFSFTLNSAYFLYELPPFSLVSPSYLALLSLVSFLAGIMCDPRFRSLKINLWDSCHNNNVGFFFTVVIRRCCLIM